ncbi:phage tail protein [Nocardia sp. NPDC059239]|uniref:Gp37-like protein n=1 Tax=unclassified Nocardia TaxID=2637762 RepID=UPI00367D8137
MDLVSLYANAQAEKAKRKAQRYSRPLVRLWDGNWQLRGICGSEISGDFKWLMNESGTGTLVLPYDHYLAKWVMDVDSRTTETVHVTVDKDGARWDGALELASIKTSEDGYTVVEMQFMHSYEHLKRIYVWSNPLTPAILQFPRDFVLPGPSRWVLKTALFLQILRLAGSLWALPDDPLDASQWFDLDMSTWPIVVAPSDFASDDSMWTIFISRWKSFHVAAAPTLELAELVVTTRRWLTGDPPPWPGASLRHGALVIDIVDKSGFSSGTSKGGNLFDGLVHTVEVLANDFLDNTDTVLPDPNDPAEYRNPGWLGTLPANPWVVYRHGDHSTIQDSEFTISPTKAVQILCGGHSAYGVNEAMSIAVQLAGDVAAAALAGEVYGAGAAGQIIDTALYPLYEDTVAAWQSYKDAPRAAEAGWSHYYEYFKDGADKAYSLSSLIALRAGMWNTRRFFAHKITIANGQPYLIGDQGYGHFFLGDRIGSTVKGMPAGQIYVDRVTALELGWSRGNAPAWQITIGPFGAIDEPMGKAMRMIANAFSGLHELGVAA